MFIKSPTRAFRLALVLSTLLLCAGCEEKKGVKIGESPPPLSGPDIRGKSVSLAELKGKVVAIYFWTDSCCADSLRELEPVYRRYKDQGLEVLAINVMDSQAEIESFAARHRISFTMLRDEDSLRFNQYKVRGFPTIFLLDRSGIVREKILGSMRTSKLEKLIRRQIEAERKAAEAYRKVRGSK